MRFWSRLLPNLAILCLIFGFGEALIHKGPGPGLPLIIVGIVLAALAVIVIVRARGSEKPPSSDRDR